MKKYCAYVGITINIDYDDDNYIEAYDEEEAKWIAKERAKEDLAFSNGYYSDDDITVFAVYEIEGDEDE